MSLPFPELLQRFRAEPYSLLGGFPGVWPVYKPSGPTSHDLVARARRLWRLRRVGHAGTLDPLAEGILVLLAGEATRLFDEFQAFPKVYRATLRWGERTDTLDAAGTPLADWVPARRDWPDAAEIEASLVRFRGEILQTPPMFSAIKRGGQPLHKLARRGVEVERAPRPALVHELSLTRAEGREAELLLKVASGFYVRSLIDELGLALGAGAVMTGLVREAVGPFDLARVLRMETGSGLVHSQ